MTIELAIIRDSRSDKYMPKIFGGARSYNGRLCGSVASAKRDLEEFLNLPPLAWQHPESGTIPGRGLVEGSVRAHVTVRIEVQVLS